jgi:hypothetical protein
MKVKISSLAQAMRWNDHLSVSEYTTRRLIFGKYINVMIKDIPDDYLEWGILNLDLEWSNYFIREWKRRNPNWHKMKV